MRVNATKKRHRVTRPPTVIRSCRGRFNIKLASKSVWYMSLGLPMRPTRRRDPPSRATTRVEMKKYRYSSRETNTFLSVVRNTDFGRSERARQATAEATGCHERPCKRVLISPLPDTIIGVPTASALQKCKLTRFRRGFSFNSLRIEPFRHAVGRCAGRSRPFHKPRG